MKQTDPMHYVSPFTIGNPTTEDVEIIDIALSTLGS